MHWLFEMDGQPPLLVRRPPDMALGCRDLDVVDIARVGDGGK
jgi:hypothetical protein